MLSRSHMIAAKYAFDRAAALVLLVLLSPLLLAISIAVKLDSLGSVLFRQERIGWGGQRFTVLKFRTMVQQADLLLDSTGMPTRNRITRIGHWLRKTSLDELPQLINIVLGQMSFIGPRPCLEDRHQQFSAEQQRRCAMRPGVTGLAQVTGRNTLPWSRRVELDIQYIDQYSWSLDLRVFVRTVKTVLTGAGIILDRNPQDVDDLPPLVAVGGAIAPDDDLPFRRVEPPCLKEYQKEPGFELLLKTINSSLAGSHDRELSELPEDYSTIHIIVNSTIGHHRAESVD